jgi:intermembrane space import and assembly protein 40
MFARWSRFAFRRCLHTRIPSAAHPAPYNRLALVLGLSAATATYITWHLSSDANRIALDSSHNGESRHPSCIVQPNSLSVKSAGKPSNPTKTPKSDPEPDLQPSTTVPEPQSTEEKDAASPDDEGATTSGGGGAFNPETGEINWDCPCLGGMAHGPCGLQFREAFSCFVFSEAEPKGMECIEKFQAMQDCFREHPDVYADGKCSLPFSTVSN